MSGEPPVVSTSLTTTQECKPLVVEVLETTKLNYKLGH